MSEDVIYHISSLNKSQSSTLHFNVSVVRFYENIDGLVWSFPDTTMIWLSHRSSGTVALSLLSLSLCLCPCLRISFFFSWLWLCILLCKCLEHFSRWYHSGRDVFSRAPASRLCSLYQFNRWGFTMSRSVEKQAGPTLFGYGAPQIWFFRWRLEM